MDMQEFKPEEKEFDIPLDDDLPAAPGGVAVQEKEKKKGRLRLLLLIPAVVLALVAGVVALNWTAIQVAVDPVGALARGAARVKELPDPVSFGALGELDLGGRAYSYSGTLEAQGTEEGLRLYLRDFTLAHDQGAETFSCYLSGDDAAASVPGLTGGDEGWYGVDLNTPIRDQAQGTIVDWYFDGGQLDALQSAADAAQEAMGTVKSLEPDPGERETVRTFLEKAGREVKRTAEGYVLSFAAGAEEAAQLCRDLGLPQELLRGEVRADFSLNRKGTLRGLSLAGDGLELTLELGEDPEGEPTPRLELQWTGKDGQTNFLALAATVSEAEALEPPAYENAFHLLPQAEE